MGRIGTRQYTLLAILAAIGVFAILFVVQKTMMTQAAPGINKTINFQGKMTDDQGLNVADGNYQFVFQLYTLSSGGSSTWSETVNIDVTDGIFHHNLGSSTALPGSVDFNTDNIFLGITFNSDPDGEMSPRIQLTASPYAFNADRLDGLDASDFLQLSPSVAQTGDIDITGSITAGGSLSIGGNATIGNATSDRLTVTSQLLGASPLAFQGATDDSFTTTLAITDPTANRTITLPNADGTICLTSGNCTGLGGMGDILQGGNSFGGAMTIGTNDNYALNLETNNTTYFTLTTAGVLQGSNGATLSVPGTGNESQKFGLGAVASGSSSLAVGHSATASGNSSTAIGHNTTANSAQAIAIGDGASATGNLAIALGSGASATGGGSISIGYLAQALQGNGSVVIGDQAIVGAGHYGSMAIGGQAATTASRQVVIGGDQTYGTRNVFIGRGVNSATPDSLVTIQTTGGLGTDIQGSNIAIASGRSTGNLAGGDILFQTSDAGATGATLRNLSTKMIILGSGNVGIGITTPASRLSVVGANGAMLQATAATSSSTGGSSPTTNWLRAPSGAVTVFIGDHTATNGLGVNDNSGNIRFNGRDVAWGDFGYYPTAGATGFGQFRLSTAGTSISTTPNAKLGVGSLYSAGSIGINETNPTKMLTIRSDTASEGILVTGSGDKQISLQRFGNLEGRLQAVSGDLLKINAPSGAGDIMTFNLSTGNVGIGTAAPSETLDINGNVRIRGTELKIATNVLTIAPATGANYGLNIYPTSDHVYLNRSTASTGANQIRIYDQNFQVAGRLSGEFSVADRQYNESFFRAIAGSNASNYRVIVQAGSGQTHDIFGIRANGSSTNDFMAVNNVGNVGIGAASPGARLHVNAVSGTAIGLIVNSGTSTGNILQLQDNGTGVMMVADGGAALFQNTTNSTTAFQVLNAAGTGNVFNVDTTNQRVGLGTSSPQARLEIVQTAQGSAQGIRLVENTTVTSLYNSNGGQTHLTTNQNNFVISSTGAASNTMIQGTGDVYVTGGTAGGGSRGVFIQSSNATAIRVYGSNEGRRVSFSNNNPQDLGARINVTTDANGTLGMVIRGNSGQTADLLQMQNNSGTALSGFNSSGNLFFANNSFTGTILMDTLSANRTFTIPAVTGNDTFCLVNLANCGGGGGSGDILQGGNNLGGTTAMSLGTINNGDLNLITNNITRLTIDASGNTNINGNTAINNGGLGVSGITDSTSGVSLISGHLDVNPASPPVGPAFYVGVQGNVMSSSANVNGDTILAGIGGDVTYSGSASLGTAVGAGGRVTNSGSGTINEAEGFTAQIMNTGSGTINSAFGLSALSPIVSAGAITNAYGLYIHPQSVSGVGTGYGIYQAGTTDINIFNGPTTFGASGTALTVSNDAVINGTLSVGTLGTADTAILVCRNTSNQLAACNTTGAGAVFVQGGNSFTAPMTIGTNDAYGLNLETSGTTRLAISSTGAGTYSGTLDVSSAVNASGQTLAVTTTSTATTGAIYGMNTSVTASPGSISSAQYTGFRNFASSASANLGSAWLVGGRGEVSYTGAGTLNIAVGLQSTGFVSASSTVTRYLSVLVEAPTVSSGGTITNSVGVAISNQNPARTTNQIGLWLANNVYAQPSGDWAIYSESTDASYLAGAMTVNGQLAVGTSDTTGTLLVLDTKTNSGDPSGVNGGLYYNSNAGKFRCYEAGSWANCITSTSVGGDLSGTTSSATVAKINGATLGTTTASSGNILVADGSQWVTRALSGAATISSTGVLTLASNSVSNTNLTAGSYSKITGLGAVTSGSIASGFGSIATANAISGSTLQANEGLALGSGAAINATHLGRNSLQIMTDTNYGGTLDAHSGALMYSTMTGGWGDAQLHFAISNNWGSYNTGTAAFSITNSGVFAAGGVFGNSGVVAAGSSNVHYGGTSGVSATGACRSATPGIFGFALGHCTSLRKYKENISNLSLDLTTLRQLRPVEYDWKDPTMGGHELGFIAEEVEAVNPMLAEYSSGELSGVKYNLLTSLLTKSVQQLDVQVQQNAATLNVAVQKNLSQDVSILNISGQLSSVSGQTSGLISSVSGIQSQLSNGEFVNLNISGQATIQNLTVVGNLSVGNTLTVANRIITKNLTITGHIKTAGTQPIAVLGSSITASDVTITISGNDSSGTVRLTTGATAVLSAEYLAQINFAQSFDGVPRVMLSPANAAAVKSTIYVDSDSISLSDFKLESIDNLEPNTTYILNYWIVE